jgi:hypothetical protein
LKPALDKQFPRSYLEKTQHKKMGWWSGQVVENLPSKHEPWVQNPNTEKKKKESNRGGKFDQSTSYTCMKISQ